MDRQRKLLLKHLLIRVRNLNPKNVIKPHRKREGKVEELSPLCSPGSTRGSFQVG